MPIAKPTSFAVSIPEVLEFQIITQKAMKLVFCKMSSDLPACLANCTLEVHFTPQIFTIKFSQKDTSSFQCHLGEAKEIFFCFHKISPEMLASSAREFQQGEP